jgi:SAM-dependent methyltransferase
MTSLTSTRMNPADLWDLCVPLLWDDDYISSLEGLLRENCITTILDCGGGTGFPAIGLRANGWKVSYVDKSNEMLETFQGNCARHNVHIPTYQADWLQLSNVLDDRFDAVLCRGNSLVYVASWGDNCLAPNSRTLVQQAIQQFYLSLNQGGLLYIDLMAAHEYDRSAYPLRKVINGATGDGRPVKMIWEVSHDSISRSRSWRTIIEQGDELYDQTYVSYLLRHDELLSDLYAAGFRRVVRRQFEGENSYDVFLAYK